VLADGWYEWMKEERASAPKLPFRYTVDDGGPFAFAGVYDGSGAAILTTAANEICAPILARMAVVLDGPEAEAAWLGDEADAAIELLTALPSSRISVAAANPAVNKAGVEGRELLTPPSDSLF
jgi:putative SOS response-associated peptidase YedK